MREGARGPAQTPPPPAPGQRQYSRITVGFLLVALVVLHVECHLAGLAMEACFMPELGTEAEGRYPSDTRTSGRGAQALGRSTPSQGLKHRIILGELGASQVTGSGS